VLIGLRAPRLATPPGPRKSVGDHFTHRRVTDRLQTLSGVMISNGTIR